MALHRGLVSAIKDATGLSLFIGKTTMTLHEKECAMAALAYLIEQAKKHGKSAYTLKKQYREIRATICSDEPQEQLGYTTLDPMENIN